MRFRLFAALLLGVLSATGFAPLGAWPLALAALAGWMALVHRAQDRRAALLLGYAFGAGHFTLGLNWIAGAFAYQDAMPPWLGWIAVVLLSLYLAVYPALAAGLAWVWGKGRPAAFALFLAAGWIASEWLRARMFTGFAWNPLGVMLADHAGIARLIGSYGLSGVAVLAAGGLWLIARRQWLQGCAIAGAAALLLLGGQALLPASTDSRTLIRVVQPNIGQQDKHEPAYDERNFAKLAALSGVPGLAPRLVLWPEAAIPDYLEREIWARQRVAQLIGPRDLLLTGGTSLIDRDGAIVGAHNSMMVVSPDAEVIARYDKAHLVPYGEYLPMRPLLSAIGLSRLVPGDLDFWPGPGPRTLDLPGFGTVGVQICYEIVFSGEVVHRERRPSFLFNPSNDAWFGSWGPPQHLAQARLRAVEEGLPVVRATPTGISAVIDGNGRLLRALPYRQAGFIEAPLPRAQKPTPFARFGNLLCLGFALLLAAIGIALHRRLG